MNTIFTRTLASVCLLLSTMLSFSQAVGDYRTISTGIWQNSAIWERFNGSAFVPAGFPTSADGVITIRNGHSVFPNAAVTVDQVVVETGGSLTVISHVTLNNTAGDEITVNGTMVFGATTIDGAGTIVITGTGTLNFEEDGVKSTGAGITFTNNGTMNWNHGGFNFSAAVVNNNIFNISANGLWQFSGGFTNNGTINKTTGAITIATPWSNSGTINLSGGSIANSEVFTNTGTIAFTNGATWNNNHIFHHNTGSVINGTGNFHNAHTLNLNINQVFPSTLVFSNANLIDGNGNLTVNNDLVIQGTIIGSGSFTLNGNGDWQSGTLGRALTIASGRTLLLSTANTKTLNNGASITNNGTLSWTEGGLNFGGPVVNNNIFNISASALWQFSGGFTNNGTINKTAGVTNMGTPWSNSGTINLSGGSLTNSALFTNTGTIAFTNGASWNNNNIFNHNTGSVINGTGSFNNAHTLNLNISQVFPSSLVFSNTNIIDGAGDLTINNDFVIRGTIIGSGSLTINGNSDFQTGTLGRSLTVDAGRTLLFSTADVKTFNGGATITNNGTLNWSEGGLNFGGAVVNNNIFDISANALWQFNGGLSNTGTLTKTNTGTVNINTPVTNSTTGIIRGIGTINFSNGLSNSGTIAPGIAIGILTLNGAQPLSASSTLSIEMLDGSGAGTGHDQLQRSGDLTLAGTLTVTETGTVPDGVYTIITLSSGTISGNFTTTNLPPGYTVQVNATDVQLVRALNALPLHWISFTGERSGKKVMLKWITENEVNTSHFIVERSSNGIDYSAIGNVTAQGNARNEYSFEDAQPVKNANFYRLRQIDQDGAWKYSVIVRVNVRDDANTLLLYPNPVKNELFIEFGGTGKNVVIKIYDGTGKMVSSTMVANQNSLSIPVAKLPRGIYVIEVSDGVTRSSSRFVKSE